MKLKDIYLGSIDAKNELLTDSPAERARFSSAFVIPPSLDLSKYIKRERYFVLGLKGTGKTALLRYISIKTEEATNNKSDFILFKSDIDEDFRKSFTQAARVTSDSANSNIEENFVDNNSSEFQGDDFEYVWRWFIYRKLLSLSEQKEINLFQKNGTYNTFRSIVNSTTQEESKSLFRLIPKMRKGTVEISHDPKIGLEFEWDSSGKAKINFHSLVRKADDLFSQLESDSDGLNLYFDELELNYNNSKQYQRDAKLIRDLVTTIEKINSIARKKSYNLCLYSAIRTEVQTSVNSLGKEINKILGDFGTEIIWNRPRVDISKQPLLNIITQRLKSSTQAEPEKLTDNQLWEKYLPKMIQNNTVSEYILHHSWYRPRDIVRLLKIAQDQYPDETSFKHYIFDSIRKKYSESCWVEITEELKSKYKSNELDGIKRILYGYKQYFSLYEIRDRIDQIKEFYASVNDLTQTYNAQAILSDLYRIGVIGNIKDKMIRFSFRGDDEILLDQQCFLHNALKAHLTVS